MQESALSSNPGERQLPSPTSPAVYGFVGAGAITAAIVEGLSADVADPPSVFLSPRSRSIGSDLAGRFPNVHVCDSNQDVLENTTSIVVAVRPQAAAAVFEELSFHPNHVLMSVMAGVPLEQLYEWAAPCGQVVRAIPLPSAARTRSLTVMHPESAVARGLFGHVGGVIVPSEEATLDVFSAATATFAAHLDYLTTIANWVADHGVDNDDATAYITHIFGQLGQSMMQRTDSLSEMTDQHMTPGGINEQFMTDLRRDGVPDVVRRSLDRILARLRG